MDDVVRRYIEQKKSQQQKERGEYLLERGIYEIEYAVNGSYYDSEKQKRYDKIPIQVTDEEYDEIRRLDYNESIYKKTSDKIARLLMILGVVIYAVGFIMGIAVGAQGSDIYGGFSWILCISSWTAPLFNGSIVLGFGKLIAVLEEIRDKK